MGLLDLVGSKIREEMKTRTDEIIKVGNEWNKTARDLISALDRLTEAIKSGSGGNAKEVLTGLNKLSKETKKLSKAFESHKRTLDDIVERL